MKGIRLIRPYIAYADVESEFRDILESGILTRGRHVTAFRQALSDYTGARHVFPTTSATTALWVCMRLLGIGRGDEVVVSDFSYPATSNVVEDVGALPVFADVSLETYNSPADEIERRLGPRTRAVIFVDALGNPTGIHDVAEVCRRRGIPLVEDAACAIGSSERGSRCGNIADLTCLSFHPRKLVATGEGGAITTAREDWARWLEVKLNHGAGGARGPALDFVDYGYNFRLSELQAVMGLKQLARLDGVVSGRNRQLDTYRQRLIPLGFTPQAVGRDVVFNVQSLVFRVPEGVDRDGLIGGLAARGIESTLGTYCLSGTTHNMRRFGDCLPNSRRLEQTTIALPCYDGLDVAAVADAVADIVAHRSRR